jgi:hypothetical protein
MGGRPARGGGIRASVAAAAAFAVIATIATAWFGRPRAIAEPPRAGVSDARAVPRVAAVPVAPRAPASPPARSVPAPRAAPDESPMPDPAPSAEAPPPAPRQAALVGFEREAARVAEDAELIDRDVLERRLDALPRRRGESDDAWRRRREEERERILAEELLVQFRLESIYETSEFPNGFDVEANVAAMERAQIAALPPEERALHLEILLGRSWQARRAVPRMGDDVDARLLSWLSEADEANP